MSTPLIFDEPQDPESRYAALASGGTASPQSTRSASSSPGELRSTDPSDRLRRSVEVALVLGTLLALGYVVPRVADNPTMKLSQIRNDIEQQSGPFGRPLEYYLRHAARYRKAVIDASADTVGAAIGGYLGRAAAHGVGAGLDALTEFSTDPNFFRGTRQRRVAAQLGNSSALISRRWAQQYARQLGKGLGEASADGLFVSLAALQRQSFGERLKWQILYSAAGLPQGEAHSVTQVAINRLNANLASRRPIGPKDLARDIGKVYVSRRATRVLHNEDAVAQNFGRQILLMNAVKTGYLPGDTQKVWLTAVDERVCPVCAPLDSVAVNIDEPFLVRSHAGLVRADTRLWVPPAHTNCRCTVMARPSVESGMITRTARFSRDNPTASEWPIPARFDQSRARTRSRMADIVEQNETPPWMDE